METFALFENGMGSAIVLDYYEPEQKPIAPEPIDIDDKEVISSADNGFRAAYQVLRHLGYLTGEKYAFSYQFGSRFYALGKSAGLAFCLKFAQEVYAHKTGTRLPYNIAATGEVSDATGRARIMRVQGMPAKFQAALACLQPGDRLWYPAENEADVGPDLRAAAVQRGIILIPVATVQQAIATLLEHAPQACPKDFSSLERHEPMTQQPHDATYQAEVLRQHTLTTLETLTARASEFELPTPPVALVDYRRKLVENTYNVLVVGEAKRGKTTFVNALIGRDILPTNEAIATSQVFRVRRAEREAYRLRFEDDSTQEISRDDLSRYGSQVVAETVGAPVLSQILRWIEVDVPVRFLPTRVHLLDTPGLGSLYAAHAVITYRFVPQADAVIVVLDSHWPLLQTELECIETLLGVTRSLFFIQTKIDTVDRQKWQDIRQRHEAILAEKFRDRLADTRVWSMSSKNLRQAAEAATAGMRRPCKKSRAIRNSPRRCTPF